MPVTELTDILSPKNKKERDPHADTEAKRAAIERAMEQSNLDIGGGTRYTIDDEATIRRLYGL